MIRSVTAIASFACCLVASLLLLSAATTPPGYAHAVLRGLDDETYLAADQQGRQRILNEMTGQLHVQVIRLLVDWTMGEPARGQYDDAGYLADLCGAARAARSAGLKVLLTVYKTPKWASDQSLWDGPPPGFQAGYDPIYAMSTAALDAWGAFAEHVARLTRGVASFYECWNEPNLWLYLYPQKTAADPHFGVRRYRSMLQHFSRGTKRGNPRAFVLAGSTSPIGTDNYLWTSPITFAKELRRLGASRYFDGYSHHPYPIGVPKPMPGPESMPTSPSHHVNLANLPSILRVFPSKPFYLTEYGYLSHDSIYFGGGGVSKVTQARYLTRAYKFVRRYPQVKLLSWYSRQDSHTSGAPADEGTYFGLRDLTGHKKPAWFAYARLAGLSP